MTTPASAKTPADLGIALPMATRITRRSGSDLTIRSTLASRNSRRIVTFSRRPGRKEATTITKSNTFQPWAKYRHGRPPKAIRPITTSKVKNARHVWSIHSSTGPIASFAAGNVIVPSTAPLRTITAIDSS